jgi:hypothetical protein
MKAIIHFSLINLLPITYFNLLPITYFYLLPTFTYYLLLPITYFYLLPTISTRVSITSLTVKLFLKVSFSVARWCSTNSARRRLSGISRSYPHVDLGLQPLDLRCHKRHFNALDSIVSYYSGRRLMGSRIMGSIG